MYVIVFCDIVAAISLDIFHRSENVNTKMFLV